MVTLGEQRSNGNLEGQAAGFCQMLVVGGGWYYPATVKLLALMSQL